MSFPVVSGGAAPAPPISLHPLNATGRATTSSRRDAAVVVAVRSVGVVQVAGDDVVDVVPVRERLVSAALAVFVSGRMSAAGVVRHASIGIGPADRKPMIVDVPAVQVVQVPVVNVIGVSLVADRRVAAAASVNMPPVVAML
jgi:hypothetical protein